MNNVEKFIHTAKAKYDSRLALQREQERLWQGK